MGSSQKGKVLRGPELLWKGFQWALLSCSLARSSTGPTISSLGSSRVYTASYRLGMQNVRDRDDRLSLASESHV